MNRFSNFLRVFSFFAGKTKKLSDNDFATVGAVFPVFAPIYYCAINGSIALLCILLSGLAIPQIIKAAIILIVYYSLKGVKLIDGYADCMEGITLALTRDVSLEKVWGAIRNASNGAYGIFNVGLLLIIQFSLFYSLLELSPKMIFFALLISALFSSHVFVSAHVGKICYNNDSDFVDFGNGVRKGFIPCFVISTSLIYVFFITLIGFSTTAIIFTFATILFSTFLGILMRTIILKIIKFYNGDVIGTVLLISECVSLLLIIITNLYVL